MKKNSKFKLDRRLSSSCFNVYDVLVYSFLIDNSYDDTLPSIDFIANCLYVHPDVVRLSILHLKRNGLIDCYPDGDVYRLKFLLNEYVSVPCSIENSLFRLRDKGIFLKIYSYLQVIESLSKGLLVESLWDISEKSGIDLAQLFDSIKYFTVIGFAKKRVIDKKDVYEFDFSNLSKYNVLINYPDGLSMNSWQNNLEDLYNDKPEIPFYVFKNGTRELRIHN